MSAEPAWLGSQARMRRWRQPATTTGQGNLARNPAWPVTALLAGYPLWWLLGLADFMWIVLAIPMAFRMAAWAAHGTRRIRTPPGFGIWMLFLVAAGAGIMVLSLTAPGTVVSPVSHRILSYADRSLTYVGLTVLLLYVGNLTEAELPRRRLGWLLGLIAVYAAVGGLAAMAAPHLQFSSPALLVLPKSVQSNTFIQASMHPGLAQVQNVLGEAKGRPKAPFDYTNTWGDCLTILVPWLLAAWWAGGSRRQRLIAGVTTALCILPLLYSLNRTCWIGAALAVGYLAVRLAARGRVAMLAGVCAALALVGILVLATPLNSLVSGRLSSHKNSDNLRSTLDVLAVRDAAASPIIGYGDTRQQQGSANSIAVGPTAKCKNCGQQEVGSTGQLWLLLVCDGFAGTALYIGFFGYGIWRFRRDRSPCGIAGSVVLLLGFVYMLSYDAVGAPLGFTMLAYAMLWRNDSAGRSSDDPANALPSSGDLPPVSAAARLKKQRDAARALA
ncbi:MAG: ligase [Streptosporangiaceae bacterium]